MRSTLVVWLFNLAARLPLGVLHRLGGALGRITYLVSGRYAARLRENIGLGLKECATEEFREILNASITEAGKGLAELPWIWQRPLKEVVGSVKACHGWEHVETAITRGKGLIFLTPHLGCFEVSALYAAARMPITVLYRPPRIAWLEPVMRGGRERGQVHLARTDVGGVRALYKALKRGEAIGLLPDQVPGTGEGEWADFFGRPAYTMTLVGRLAESSGATVLMAYAERLPGGAGYVIHITPLELNPEEPVARQINASLEQVIRACPTQYLWGYNRYKTPAGAAAPDAVKEQ
jgi:Kdo2-lipid IVA lauroyltransferase/acyltransferase